MPGPLSPRQPLLSPTKDFEDHNQVFTLKESPLPPIKLHDKRPRTFSRASYQSSSSSLPLPSPDTSFGNPQSGPSNFYFSARAHADPLEQDSSTRAQPEIHDPRMDQEGTSGAAEPSSRGAGPFGQRRRQSTATHFPGTATPDAVMSEDKQPFAHLSDHKHDVEEEEEEDDLVAIDGHDLAARDDGNQGYQPLHSGLSDIAGRTSKTLRKKEFWRKAIMNLSLIGSWYCFSTLMNLYNSWLFSDKHHKLSYPLFVTSIHMLVQFGLSSSLMCFFHNSPRIVPRQRNGKRARPDGQSWMSKVVPCAFATALDIGLSNLSLKTITLTFYTMCKSSNLAFVLFFAFLFRLEKVRLALIGIIALITIGVIMMVAAETQFVLEGAIEVLTASAMGGLRWALTQLLLDRESLGMNNPIATIFWLSPVMSISMFSVSILVEDWSGMINGPFFRNASESLKTIALMVAPGFIAFCMNLSEFALIQRTSVVTLSVAGIFKEVLTILVSSTVFGDELTPINVTGLCVALTGIALYNWLKYQILIGDGNDVGGRGSSTQLGTGRLARGPPLLTGYSHLGDGEVSRGDRTSSATRGHEGGDVLFEGNHPEAAPSLAMSEREESRRASPAPRAPLSEAEKEKLRKREEEADMHGWDYSGTVRTGNGYDDGSDTE